MPVAAAVESAEGSTLLFGLDPKDHGQSEMQLFAEAFAARSLCTTAPMASTRPVDFRCRRLLLACQAFGIP